MIKALIFFVLGAASIVLLIRAFEELLKEKAQIEKNSEDQEKRVEEVLKNLNEKYSKCGNLVHDTVPVSNDEADNKIEKPTDDWSSDIPEYYKDTDWTVSFGLGLSF